MRYSANSLFAQFLGTVFQEELARERNNARGQKSEAKEYMAMVTDLFEKGDVDASGDLSYEARIDFP